MYESNNDLSPEITEEVKSPPIIYNIEEMKDRIYESLLDTPSRDIEKIYNDWRIARDQISRANDFVLKASKRLKELSTFFIQLDDTCVCNAQITLGIRDIEDALQSLYNFVQKNAEGLERIRPKKRGSKRELGKSTVRSLPNGKKEIRTLIDYTDIGGGQVLPRFLVEEVDQDDAVGYRDGSAVINEHYLQGPKEEVALAPKIQRPSLEED